MIYAGFLKRFGAFWIDFLIFSPLILLAFWGNEKWRLYEVYYFIPSLIIGLLYSVYLVKRYGGTPGKLILKIKITKLDGSDVGYKEALLRHSVILILSIITSLLSFPVLLDMSDSIYFSMDINARFAYRKELEPELNSIFNLITGIWVYSEFIVMLLNEKKRAIHDYMAGTVVVEKESIGNS